MAEWSIAAVLKTVVLRGTGGSNPSLSARKRQVKYSNLFEGFYLPFSCKEARGSEGMDLSIPLSPQNCKTANGSICLSDLPLFFLYTYPKKESPFQPKQNPQNNIIFVPQI